MSDDKRIRPRADPGHLANPTGEDSAPLATLPRGMRKASGYFFGMNAHLLKTPLVLAARVHYYATKLKLTPEELREVYRRLASPERQAGHEHAGLLLADLAREVNTVLGERADRQRKEAEAKAAKEPEALSPEERERSRLMLEQYRKNGFKLNPTQQPEE